MFTIVFISRRLTGLVPILLLSVLTGLAGGIKIPGSQSTVLQIGAPIPSMITGPVIHSYAVKLQAGQFFEIQIERTGWVVEATLISPSGKAVANGDGSWENVEADLLSHIAEESGEYKIEIRLFFPTARGGRYSIELIALRTPTETDRFRVSANQAVAKANHRRLRWKNESKEAIAEFEEAVKFWQAAGDKVNEAMTYSSIAQLYRSQGNLPVAAEYFEKALSIFRAEGKPASEVQAMTDLSYVYAKRGQLFRGVGLAKESLTLSRSRNDKNGECRALLLLGGISNGAGNVRAGLEYNEQSQPVCAAASTPLGERIAQTQIADSYVFLGEPQRALDHFNRALEIVTPAFDAFAQGYIRLNLARLKLQNGDFQEALTQGKQSLGFFQQSGTRDWEAKTRQTLGQIYQALGDEEQTLDSYTKGLELCDAVGDVYLKALLLLDLSGASIKFGRQEKAEMYLEQAANAFREKGAPNSQVEAFKQFGRLELFRKNSGAAVERFTQALELSRKSDLAVHETEILWLLGTANLTANHREQAAECFLQALRLAREKSLVEFEIQSLGGLARLSQDRGDYREAQTSLEAALNLIESSRNRIRSLDFRRSFFTSTQSFYESYIDVLMSQAEHGAEGGKAAYLALALRAVERARARSLLDLLAEAKADIKQGIDPELLGKERELQQRLTAKAERLWLLGQQGKNIEQGKALKAELDAILLQQRDLAAQIRVQSPKYAAIAQPQPLTLEEIQKQVVSPGDLLLEYALGEKRSFLFAVTQQEIKSFTLPGRGEIEALARRAFNRLETYGAPPPFKSIQERQAWQTQIQREYLEAATSLSHILLSPIDPLRAGKRLMIVSDGALHYLPFAALPEPGGKGEENLEKAVSVMRPNQPAIHWRPLVLAHEIITLPSASTLALLRNELRGREEAPKMLAVLADPVFDQKDIRLNREPIAAGGKTAAAKEGVVSKASLRKELSRQLDELAGADRILPRLPGSRREGRAILELIPEALRKAAFDFDASRATATDPDLGNYRFLHFATHGVLNSTHPELSGLVLSLFDRQGQRQDGVLRSNDIFNLKLPVELVVMSGCRTALGKESGGEGLIGLTRGFFYAGVRRTMASLWNVDDLATAELMRRFYQKMLGEEKLSPSAALRAAQISMWNDQHKKWNAPYYWAAFTIQGEW